MTEVLPVPVLRVAHGARHGGHGAAAVAHAVLPGGAATLAMPRPRAAVAGRGRRVVEHRVDLEDLVEGQLRAQAGGLGAAAGGGLEHAAGNGRILDLLQGELRMDVRLGLTFLRVIRGAVDPTAWQSLVLFDQRGRVRHDFRGHLFRYAAHHILA